MSLLIITNGDVVAETLAEAKPEATVLPWRDVMHEGPVRDLDPAAFRQERAEHLADGEVNTIESVVNDLEQRDQLIVDHAKFDRIELWFEHDLYDQLQIVHIVNMLASLGRSENVYHIPSSRHLGPIPPDQILKLEELTLPVNAPMFATAIDVWKAYTSPTPEALAVARKGPIAGFPFLAQAITRALQELPGLDGLTRTERQTLYTIDRGVVRPGMMFARVLNMEEAAFLGDWSFFKILTDLCAGPSPLLEGLSEPFAPALFQDDKRRKAFITTGVSLTSFGEEVLAGRQIRTDHADIDTWVGGTHVSGQNLWRWDDAAEELIAPNNTLH